jgi:hypothetical protein
MDLGRLRGGGRVGRRLGFSTQRRRDAEENAELIGGYGVRRWRVWGAKTGVFDAETQRRGGKRGVDWRLWSTGVWIWGAYDVAGAWGSGKLGCSIRRLPIVAVPAAGREERWRRLVRVHAGVNCALLSDSESVGCGSGAGGSGCGSGCSIVGLGSFGNWSGGNSFGRSCSI